MTAATTRRPAKRLFDVVGALVALLVFSPALLIIAAIIRIGMGSPVLFRQKRPGLNGRPFTLLKFRTMAVARDADALPDEARLTTLGRVLRRTSLDELPELINVLRGDMSFVGPRPLLMRYLPLYTPEQARRHDVKPGITGWAQVNGRNAISWEERFKLDTWYVDHQGLWLDVKTLLLTPLSILSCRNISAAGHATMPAFEGTGTASQESSPATTDGATGADRSEPNPGSPRSTEGGTDS